MTSLLLALQFLTIIPVKIRNINERKIANSMIYFPLAGLLLGLILTGANYFLSWLNFEPFLINTILVVLLTVLTAGIHLDGLADTTDALLSRKSKEEMLKIMRDSHIGVMGVLSLICVILLKVAFLSSLDVPLKTASLLLMCILSRWSLVWAIFLFPYARDEGKAKLFIQGANFKIFIWATMIVLACVTATLKFKGLFIFAIIALSTYIIGKFISKKIGGITGDTLGATIELAEIVTLLTVCIAQGAFYG